MKKKTIRRGRGKKKHYFTKEHEKDIIEYNNTDCLRRRQKLYRDSIQPVFSELVDKIILTYKFTNLDNLEVHRDECKSFLMTVIHKFNPEKNPEKKTTAFSYFTTITRNWFFRKTKDQNKKLKKEIQFQDLNDFHESESEFLVTYNDFHEKEEFEQFWEYLKLEMEKWDMTTLRENEKKVLNAIFDIFSKKENIEVFNKKAIYLYLRELTDLNTKQIVSNLNKFRVRYKTFKERWDSGEI